MADKLQIPKEAEVVLVVGDREQSFGLFTMIQKLRPLVDKMAAAVTGAEQDAVLPQIQAAWGIEGLGPMQAWAAAQALFDRYNALLVRKNV